MVKVTRREQGGRGARGGKGGERLWRRGGGEGAGVWGEKSRSNRTGRQRVPAATTPSYTSTCPDEPKERLGGIQEQPEITSRPLKACLICGTENRKQVAGSEREVGKLGKSSDVPLTK